MMPRFSIPAHSKLEACPQSSSETYLAASNACGLFHMGERSADARPLNVDEGECLAGLLRPAFLCGLFGYLFPTFCRHPSRPRPATHTPQRHGGVLSVVRGQVLDLASGNPADHNGVADHVAGSLFAFRASWHLLRNL